MRVEEVLRMTATMMGGKGDGGGGDGDNDGRVSGVTGVGVHCRGWCSRPQ
jgi:hypothetical protein